MRFPGVKTRYCDLPALLALSLSNRALHKISAPFLYNHVTITLDRDGIRENTLYLLGSQDHRYIGLIRHLTLQISDADPREDGNNAVEPVAVIREPTPALPTPAATIFDKALNLLRGVIPELPGGDYQDDDSDDEEPITAAPVTPKAVSAFNGTAGPENTLKLFRKFFARFTEDQLLSFE